MSEDYKALIRNALVIAQQVGPKEVEIRPGLAGSDWTNNFQAVPAITSVRLAGQFTLNTAT